MSLKRTMSYLRGFFIGGLIGAGAALLFAPQSGSQTRAQIRGKGAELVDKAQGTYSDVKAKIADVASEVEQTAVQAKEKVNQATTQNEPYVRGTTRS